MTLECLDLLEQSLVNKISILEEVTSLSEKQKEIVTEEKVDWDAFDRLVDQKDDLITKLNNMDEGFEAVYDRIRTEVADKKELYKEQIVRIQELIRKVTEKSTGLMALEERNKNVITASFQRERKKITQSKSSNKVASSYYQNMNRINYIDPQLMDRKK